MITREENKAKISHRISQQIETYVHASHSNIMSEKGHAEFLFAVLKHSRQKVNNTHLSAALNLKPSAANMRLVRLRRKFASNGAKVDGKDLKFLEKIFEINEGKVDIKGLAAELGLQYSAVSMRLTRLRAKIAEKNSLGKRRDKTEAIEVSVTASAFVSEMDGITIKEEMKQGHAG